MLLLSSSSSLLVARLGVVQYAFAMPNSSFLLPFSPSCVPTCQTPRTKRSACFFPHPPSLVPPPQAPHAVTCWLPFFGDLHWTSQQSTYTTRHAQAPHTKILPSISTHPRTLTGESCLCVCVQFLPSLLVPLCPRSDTLLPPPQPLPRRRAYYYPSSRRWPARRRKTTHPPHQPKHDDATLLHPPSRGGGRSRSCRRSRRSCRRRAGHRDRGPGQRHDDGRRSSSSLVLVGGKPSTEQGSPLVVYHTDTRGSSRSLHRRLFLLLLPQHHPSLHPSLRPGGPASVSLALGALGAGTVLFQLA